MRRNLKVLPWILAISAAAFLAPNVQASLEIGDAQFFAATPGGPSGLEAQAGFWYTTAGNPDNYVVLPGDILNGVKLDGVAMLHVARPDGTFRSSGALLGTGRHILTAGHSFFDKSTSLYVPNAPVEVYFNLPDSGDVMIPGKPIAVDPGYRAFFESNWASDPFACIVHGGDIGIVELDFTAPEDADRYDVYSASDEVGKVGGPKVGYGWSGHGSTGTSFPHGIPSGTKRAGSNKYDDTADPLLEDLGFMPGVDFIPGSTLMYDFDNGVKANDAFWFFFGLLGLGLGEDEVSAAPGDSGGPTFIDGKIAGVTSYGITVVDTETNLTSDVDYLLNSTFGEFSVDTRASLHADWIRAVIPEPSSIVVWSLLGLLGVTVGSWRRRRKAA